VEFTSPWPEKVFVPTHLKRGAVLVITEGGAGYYQTPFDPETGTRGWIADDWQNLQKRSRVVYYSEGLWGENAPGLLEDVRGKKFFKGELVTIRF